MNTSSIIANSASPTAEQIIANTSDVVASSQDIQNFSKNRSKDMYAGSVSLDITYSDLARNYVKPKQSDITLSINDIVPNSSEVGPRTNEAAPRSLDLAQTSRNIFPHPQDVLPTPKEIMKAGDVRSQVVKSIYEEVQKNIEKLNRYNLSKGNRLIKTIDVSVT